MDNLNKTIAEFREAYTRSGEWQLVHCPVLVNSNDRDPLYQDITFYFIIRQSSTSVAPSSAFDDELDGYDGLSASLLSFLAHTNLIRQ